MAMNIEAANGPDTDNCMTALTRFMAERRKPQTIKNHKGKNCMVAAREFVEPEKAWDPEQVTVPMVQSIVFLDFQPVGRTALWGKSEKNGAQLKESDNATL